MKIGFVSTSDVNDKTAWSGTTHYIYKQLKEKFPDILIISPVNVKNVILKIICRSLEFPFKFFYRKKCLSLYDSYFLPKAQSRYIDNSIKNISLDFLISTNSMPFLYTKNNIPLIIITDATVKLLFYEYSGGSGWTKLFYKNLEKNSLKVTHKSALIVSSSKSTTRSLLDDYNIPSAKVVTIPFGANIDTTSRNKIRRVIEKNKPVNFLFIGRDWERKGGSFAVILCDVLISRMVDVTLTVVGCKVPKEFERTYLKNYIYLNKNSNDDLALLTRLYELSHFFMVFSESEMYGIVFCEAAAFGLPVITFSVGGIPDIVINGFTGLALTKNTKSEVFADKIIRLINNSELYRSMSLEALKRYESVLNWDVFTESLIRHLRNRMANQH